MPSISTILFFEWAAALILSIWALRIAQFFSVRQPRVAKRPLEPLSVKVAVILPIKGVDEDTADNIRCLLDQDYPNFRLIFAVESEDDTALALIEKLTAGLPPHKMDVVVAGLAQDRGQKIHNQLAAVERTDDSDEILVFLDADARPGPNWIHALVTPLTYGEHIGASTGYRYYVPVQPTSANAAASLLNAGVAALFGPYRRAFAWGGSMAVRRKDFFDYGIHSAWQNALSDDFVLAYCVKWLNKKKIHFVPACIVPSAANFTWESFLEFAVRQYRITRICAPIVWLTAVCGTIMFLLAFWYTLTFAIRAAIHPPAGRSYEALILTAMFVSLYGLRIVRGFFLLHGAKQLLPDHARAIGKTWFWFTLGYPLVQAVNLGALLASAVGRTIIWRGVVYTMHSRLRTTVHRAATPPARAAGKTCEMAQTH